MAQQAGPEGSLWIPAWEAYYPSSSEKGATITTGIVLDPKLRSGFAGVRLVMVCRDNLEHLEKLGLLMSSHNRARSERRSMGGSLKGYEQGAEVPMVFTVLLEIYPLDDLPRAAPILSTQIPIAFKVLNSLQIRDTPYRIVYDSTSSNADFSGPHYFQPFISYERGDRHYTWRSTAWVFHVQWLELSARRPALDLPSNVIRSVAWYVTAFKAMGWRSDLFHLGLVKKSWIFVHELFLSESFTEDHDWDPAPLRGVLSYVSRNPSRGEGISRMDLSAPGPFRFEDTGGLIELSGDLKPFCQLYSYTNALKTVNVRQTVSLSPSTFQRLLDLAKKSPTVRSFGFNNLVEPGDKSLTEVINLAADWWTDLEEFNATTCLISVQDTAADANPGLLFPKLKALRLQYCTLPAPYLMAFSSPTLRTFILRQIPGIKASELRAFLVSVSGTLGYMSITRCSVQRDEDGLPLDVAMSSMASLSHAEITTDVASELSLLGKPPKEPASSGISFIPVDGGALLYPSGVLMALRTTTWTNARIASKVHWTADEIKEAKKIRKERWPRLKFMINIPGGTI